MVDGARIETHAGRRGVQVGANVLRISEGGMRGIRLKRWPLLEKILSLSLDAHEWVIP